MSRNRIRRRCSSTVPSSSHSTVSIAVELGPVLLWRAVCESSRKARLTGCSKITKPRATWLASSARPVEHHLVLEEAAGELGRLRGEHAAPVRLRGACVRRGEQDGREEEGRRGAAQHSAQRQRTPAALVSATSAPSATTRSISSSTSAASLPVASATRVFSAGDAVAGQRGQRLDRLVEQQLPEQRLAPAAVVHLELVARELAGGVEVVLVAHVALDRLLVLVGHRLDRGRVGARRARHHVVGVVLPPVGVQDLEAVLRRAVAHLGAGEGRQDVEAVERAELLVELVGEVDGLAGASPPSRPAAR